MIQQHKTRQFYYRRCEDDKEDEVRNYAIESKNGGAWDLEKILSMRDTISALPIHPAAKSKSISFSVRLKQQQHQQQLKKERSKYQQESLF